MDQQQRGRQLREQRLIVRRSCRAMLRAKRLRSPTGPISESISCPVHPHRLPSSDVSPRGTHIEQINRIAQTLGSYKRSNPANARTGETFGIVQNIGSHNFANSTTCREVTLAPGRAEIHKCLLLEKQSCRQSVLVMAEVAVTGRNSGNSVEKWS